MRARDIKVGGVYLYSRNEPVRVVEILSKREAALRGCGLIWVESAVDGGIYGKCSVRSRELQHLPPLDRLAAI